VCVCVYVRALRTTSALTAVCTYCQLIKGGGKTHVCFINYNIVTSLKAKLETGCCVKNSRVYKLYSVTICKRPKICVVKDKEHVTQRG
jgi:hypothetical protein